MIERRHPRLRDSHFAEAQKFCSMAVDLSPSRAEENGYSGHPSTSIGTVHWRNVVYQCSGAFLCGETHLAFLGWEWR